MLFSLLKEIFWRKSSAVSEQPLVTSIDVVQGVERSVLNVGGNSKAIAIPDYYDGWVHLLLDIDPRGEPDIVCDSRLLNNLPPNQFDAVYCSHNLEHYYRHDVQKVLAGFYHVLKETGFIDIRVPDMGELIQLVSQQSLDIDDFLYDSSSGPIHVIDVIYGLRREIAESGNDFFAHKTGFTQKSLVRIIEAAGFGPIYTSGSNLEVRAIAFKSTPSGALLDLLGINSAA